MQYVNIQENTIIVAVPGPYNFGKAKAIKNEINTALQSGCTKMVIDFNNTTEIDSAGISQLSEFRKKVKPENFSARNAKGRTLTTLKSCNLDSWLIN